MTPKKSVGIGSTAGSVKSVSPDWRNPNWTRFPGPVAGTTSLVATGGGLLFGGDANGRFRAFDQTTGKILWETNLGAPVTGTGATLTTTNDFGNADQRFFRLRLVN